MFANLLAVAVRRSADRIRASEADQTRGAQPRAFVGGYFSEALPFLPVRASLRDLLLSAGNEVPPHENLLGEWRPADQ